VLEGLDAAGRSRWRTELAPIGSGSLSSVTAAAATGSGALVLASDRQASRIGLLTVSGGGDVLHASELVLAQAKVGEPLLQSMISDGVRGAIAAIPTSLDVGGAATLLLRLDARAEVSWSAFVKPMSRVQAMSIAQGRLVLAGSTVVDGSEALLIAELDANGRLAWARAMSATPSLRPSAAGAAVARMASGDLVVVLAAGGTTVPDLAVVRLDERGAVRWVRALRRPVPADAPANPMDYAPGPMLQGVVAEGEVALVAVTIPTNRNGSNQLVLLRVAADGSLTAQRSVPAATSKPLSLSLVANGVVVRSDDMPDCLFSASQPADCNGPEVPVSLPASDIRVVTSEAMAWSVPAPSKATPIDVQCAR
jgi:hypothetical protein